MWIPCLSGLEPWTLIRSMANHHVDNDSDPTVRSFVHERSEIAQIAKGGMNPEIIGNVVPVVLSGDG